MARLCFEDVFESDEMILEQGEDAQLMVAIVSGRARVTHDGGTVATFGAGDVVSAPSAEESQTAGAPTGDESEECGEELG